MKIAAFENLVVDFINRDGVLFEKGVEGKVDKVLAAANMAKAWAQRLWKFQRTETSVQLVLSATDGASLLVATELNSTTLVRVRSILRAFVVATDGGLVPIGFADRSEEFESVKRRFEGAALDATLRPVSGAVAACDVRLVQHGDNVTLSPWPRDLFGAASGTVVLDVYQQLPDYSATHEEDFFLVECVDWMLLRTIYYLNLFLKEDERIPLSGKMMEEAWNAVITWDASLISAPPTNRD